MKTKKAAFLLAFAALAGADEPDEGSIPEPKTLSVFEANTASDVAMLGNPTTIESRESKATFTLIEVRTHGEQEVHGVQLLLQRADLEDSLYLDVRLLAPLRNEFLGLDRRYKRNRACEAQQRCVHGIARCRPSQTIRQAVCPGFYSTPGGERGALVSTTRGSFLFPSVAPMKFEREISALIFAASQIER